MFRFEAMEQKKEDKGFQFDAVCREPNEETLAAMREAKEGKNLTAVDLSNFEAFVESLE